MEQRGLGRGKGARQPAAKAKNEATAVTAADTFLSWCDALVRSSDSSLPSLSFFSVSRMSSLSLSLSFSVPYTVCHLTHRLFLNRSLTFVFISFCPSFPHVCLSLSTIPAPVHQFGRTPKSRILRLVSLPSLSRIFIMSICVFFFFAFARSLSCAHCHDFLLNLSCSLLLYLVLFVAFFSSASLV